MFKDVSQIKPRFDRVDPLCRGNVAQLEAKGPVYDERSAAMLSGSQKMLKQSMTHSHIFSLGCFFQP